MTGEPYTIPVFLCLHFESELVLSHLYSHFLSKERVSQKVRRKMDHKLAGVRRGGGVCAFRGMKRFQKVQ